MIRRALQMREFALFAACVGLFAGFSVLIPDFLDAYGLAEQLRYLVVPGMIAVPMTFIIATAGIDLSVGAMVALCGILLGMLHEDFGLPLPVACAGAVLAGLLAGGFNGSVIAYAGVPPLVVTLATMTLFRGLATGLSQAQPYRAFPPEFIHISQGNVFSLTSSAGTELFILPLPAIALGGVVALGVLVLRRSWVGRHVELIGENETAARFAAIPVPSLKLALYAACGLVCGICAIYHIALVGTAKSDAAMGYELKAIACVVLGGTRISGGHASVPGTLLGLLLLGMLGYGLHLAGVNDEVVIIVEGLLLVATAVLNEWLFRRGEARK
jgi:rhamnose transport system permease protein